MLSRVPRSIVPMAMEQVLEQALPRFMSNTGIEHFTLPTNSGFDGVVKMFPEDFVVTEITTDGQLVVLDNVDIPPLPELAKPLPEDGERGTPKEPRPHPSTTPPLASLITSEQYTIVSAAAEKYASTADPSSVVRISLGTFPDKQARTPVHIATRLAFPVLQTSTTRNEEGESEIWVLPDPNYVQLRELLGQEEAKRLLIFLNISDRSEKTVHQLPSDESKEHRTKVHRLLSELYGHIVETKSYVARPSKRAKLGEGQDSPSGEQLPQISVRFRKQTRHHLRIRQEVGGDSRDLCTQFVLRKKNLETLDAIQKLSSALHSHPSHFSFAGNKDRRAVTLQHMTVRGISADRLHAAADNPLLSNLTTGNYRYVSRPLHLGELGGNQFKITVRNVRARDASQDLRLTVPMAVREIEERGFVNYFGPQRFGWSKTHQQLTGPQIGLAMLQGNHKAAVDLFLGEEDSVSDDCVQAAKRYFQQSHDALGALERMPEFKVRERLILKALHHHGYNKHGCTSALMSIPYSSRLLHIHSFSSLIWNHMASFRVKQYGMEAVEGDLVLQEVQSKGTAKPTWKETVHVLTSEDIQSGRYLIRDVVLPSPGSDTIFPGNNVADWLRELLPLAGITLGSFRLRGLGIRAPGTYRKLIAYPRHLRWKWVEPSTATRTGRERLPSHGAACVPMVAEEPRPQLQYCGDPAIPHQPPKAVSPSNTEGGRQEEASKPSTDGGMEGEEAAEEGCEAMEISFELESSCYATVFLRELMRSEGT